MKKLLAQFSYGKKILAIIVGLFAALAVGCTDKSGAIEEPLPPWSYVTPTVQNLKTYATSISKCSGGILRLTCDWVSPNTVSTATAYVGFVRTIQDPKTEPIGVIASDVATISKDIRAGLAWQTTIATTTEIPCVASDTEAFYAKFSVPISIPTRIGTDETAGQWGAEIPFAHNDIASAPLGVHQMIFYMYINHQKTNTLSFELTFVP
ncbi:MAG: hypothetical protein PHD82_04595 [Candidatus Riflebacteria bacterium]|jgi:hypothetical protein|nr:hypothetical protein [Candidatus Riflebacteria bacterium]